jgi:diguanylate cyclase (GGDEF)-like protein
MNLCTKVKKLNIQFSGKSLPPISVSAGIAIYPKNGIDARSLIAAADLALYQAKSLGRDRVACASARE